MKTQTNPNQSPISEASANLAQPLNVIANAPTGGRDVKISKRSIFRMLGGTLTLLCAAQMFVACQPNSGGRGSPTADAPVLGGAGTGDTGGGNGLNNKVFERFAVDIQKTEPWIQYISPIAAHLQTLSPSDSNADMNADYREILPLIAKTRVWYIAPVKLNDIKKSSLGVEVFQDPVQQLALQNIRREVWIDKCKHDGPAKIRADKTVCPPEDTNDAAPEITDADRAELYMHEVVMGIYLLRFLPFDELMRILSEESQVATDVQFMKEFNKLNPSEAPRALDAQDYARIRAMTVWMMKHAASIKSFEEMRIEFHRNSFDPRLFTPGGMKPITTETPAEAYRTTSLSQLHDAIVMAPKLGLMPSTCEISAKGIANVKCAISSQRRNGPDGLSFVDIRFDLESNGERQSFVTSQASGTAINKMTSEAKLFSSTLPVHNGNGLLHYFGQAVRLENAASADAAQVVREGDSLYEVYIYWSDDLRTVKSIALLQNKIIRVHDVRPYDGGAFKDQTVTADYGTPADKERLDIVAASVIPGSALSYRSRLSGGNALIRGITINRQFKTAK